VSCGEPFDAGPGPFTFDGGQLPGAYTAHDLQDPSGPNWGLVHFPDGGGGRATVYGVIATTPKTLISDGGFVCTYGAWVSDPGGGPYSGLLVIAYGYRNGSGVCDSDGIIPDDLQPGDALKLTGFVKEFCLDPGTFQPTWPCPGDSAVTELKLVDGGAQILGTAPLPAPTVVDPGQIGTGSGYDNAPYDGVLLQVRRSDDQMMHVTSENPDAPAYFGNWVLESHVWVNHQFRYDTDPAAGDAFLCATGVYGYENGNWKIQPRSDRDLGSAP